MDNQTPSFEHDVKPLFRERDRLAMKNAFDLWNHDDVAANAAAILEHVRNGSMPCDGPWPPESVALFERWSTSGMHP